MEPPSTGTDCAGAYSAQRPRLWPKGFALCQGPRQDVFRQAMNVGRWAAVMSAASFQGVLGIYFGDHFTPLRSSGSNLTLGARVLTAVMILSGSAVHWKGFDWALWSSRKRLMAAWRSVTDRKDAALETPLREDGEEALDGVEP
jgi:hypothetical protein